MMKNIKRIGFGFLFFLCDIYFVYHNISQPIINAGH